MPLALFPVADRLHRFGNESKEKQEAKKVNKSIFHKCFALISTKLVDHEDTTLPVSFAVQTIGVNSLLPIGLREHYQSFMLPKDHPVFDAINVGLMQEIQKYSWEELQRKYNVKGN